MTNEGINDGIVYEASLDEVRRSKNEARNLKTSASFKYGIVWHRTEVTGGTSVPFDKAGEGAGISVRCALVPTRSHAVCVWGGGVVVGGGGGKSG